MEEREDLIIDAENPLNVIVRECIRWEMGPDRYDTPVKHLLEEEGLDLPLRCVGVVLEFKEGPRGVSDYGDDCVEVMGGDEPLKAFHQGRSTLVDRLDHGLILDLFQDS